MITSKKKSALDKSTHSKAASNKKSSKPATASSSDDLGALDEKRSQHFARHEAMLLAKTFTVSISLVMQPATVVTSERHFIPPSQPATGFSTLNSTGLVYQVTSSQT